MKTAIRGIRAAVKWAVGKVCPNCKSDDLYFAHKNTPNDDCFECGSCGLLQSNDKLINA